MSIRLPPAPLVSVARYVRGAQQALQFVERWSHHDRALHENALEYAGILPLITTLVLSRLRRELAFNDALVRDALALYQLGSIRYKEAGRDPPFQKRTQIHGQREYVAAMDHAMQLPEGLRTAILHPLLLPWITSSIVPRSNDELAVLQRLRATAKTEANVFWLVVHFSFVLYAVAEYEENKNGDILIEALRTAHKELVHFARLFPAFGASFYTPAVATWADKLLTAAAVSTTGSSPSPT